MGLVLGLAFPGGCGLLGEGHPLLKMPLSPPVPAFRARHSCGPIGGSLAKNLRATGLVLVAARPCPGPWLLAGVMGWTGEDGGRGIQWP